VLGFLYRVLNLFLSPVPLALGLLIAALVFRRRRVLQRFCYVLAMLVLFVCGNGFVVDRLTRSLEWQHLPPNPVPTADAILILSGGVRDRRPPRPTIEVNEAGDRVLYGGELFQQGRAPQVFVTGNIATGSIATGPEAADMAELLERLSVPRAAIVLETKAQNTHEHAIHLCPMFAERQVRRVLLVTSAIHMPRSLGAFRRGCPGVDYIPAPTDFRATQPLTAPWYRALAVIIPTTHSLVGFSDVTHEYIGMLYYRLRGWM
jgi:uncharacterized SAM-binding protein YcdF (DUF218 family)